MTFRPKLPCKFGDSCFKFKQGNCTYSHDSSTGGGGISSQIKPGGGGMGGMGGIGGMGGMGGRGNGGGVGGGGTGGGFAPNPNRPCKFGTDCNSWKQGKCTFYHPQPYQGGNDMQKQINPTPFVQGQMSNPQGQNTGDMNQSGKCKYGNNCRRHQQNKCPLDHSGPSISNEQYCKFWMKGNCNNPNCKKQHSVSIDGSVERIFYSDAFPDHIKSGIGAMTVGENHILFPRMGNTFYSLQFSPATESVQKMEFSLPNDEPILYSKIDGNWIMFSYGTKFQTIKLWNSQNGQHIFTIDQAHQKPVTGLAILNDQILISSSNDQIPIKVWTLQDNKFILNQDITKKFVSDINNPKVQILFLKVVKFDKPYLCAGTNDARVLLWILQGNASFQAISMAKLAPYVNIYDFDIKSIQQNPCGFIFAWTADKQNSGIFLVSLQNVQNIIPLYQQKSLMIKMVVTPSLYLITANLNKEVNFYKIEFGQNGPSVRKVGNAFFDNFINEILYCQITTANLINIKNVLVMESFIESNNKNAETNKGSVSIFRID